MSAIEAIGGTTVYIRDNGGINQYSYNGNTWSPLSFPCTINNTNTSAGVLKIYFTTDIELSAGGEYFQFISDNIQVGNTALNTGGTRPTITIPQDNYDGLFQNGSSGVNGHTNIFIYNLIIDGSGYGTQVGGGWVGQKFFGLGASNNYIINCSSLGDINGGGILGDSAANVILIGCSSSGDIYDTAGGIVGQSVDSVSVGSCWSSGDMLGNGAGGIVGSNTVGVSVQNCYSTGVISGSNAGGIVGSNIANANISNCYSRGVIQGDNAGGICGSIAVFSGSSSVSITNCYTTGDVNGFVSGGICGILIVTGGTVDVYIQNCYTTGTATVGYMIGNDTTINGTNPYPYRFVLLDNYSEAGSPGGTPGTWNTSHANSTLTGTGTLVGSTWVNTVGGQPYELLTIGYTPYGGINISSNSLVRSYSQTVSAGSSTNAAFITGVTYSLLDVTGGDAASQDLITINGTTGVVSVPTSVVSGTYTVYLRNTGSYNITTFVLTVTGGSTPSIAANIVPIGFKRLDYDKFMHLVFGNRLVLERLSNSNVRFNNYADYMKYQIARSTISTK